jgi:hypothetical protein
MKKINGKPMSYWEHMGKELLVDALVRAAIDYGWDIDPKFQSIPQKIAADRLMAMANAEDAEIVKELLAERDRCRENIALFVASLSGKTGGSGRSVGGQKRR